ncbi:hypothetical protein MTR62_09045, partial [Novosphingobium sp. 1949]
RAANPRRCPPARAPPERRPPRSRPPGFRTGRGGFQKVSPAAGLNFLNETAISCGMNSTISEFSRFTYLDENFADLRNYCEDKGIWICQSLRRKGPFTFALARNDEVASDLSQRFS